MGWLRGISLRARLVIILAIGVAVVAASKGAPWYEGIVHDLGIAFVVAAILGLTVDFALKTEIARDAFKATLGYILRPEFRDEVARITGYKFLCEHHVLLIEIKLLENNTVEVTTSIERTIRNITAYSEKARNFIYIDDWGFENGPSQIIACNLIFNSKTYEGTPVNVEPFRQKQETEEVNIGPNETYTVFSKFKEFKRSNDIAYVHLSAPTLNPEIEVRLPPELDRSFSFGGVGTSIERHYYADRERLSGMYFPHQAMNVRWWPKPVAD
jgi:hypothetical protein